MGEVTKIAWTGTVSPDGTLVKGATFNPVWGCTKVSPGCKFCYAEALDLRFHAEDRHWGPNAPRKEFGDGHWNEPLQWNRKAQASGIRRKVFSGSMCDIFEDEFPEKTRERLFDTIARTPWLDWLLLTKRPANIAGMLPPTWGDGWANVWLGASAEDQEWLDRRLASLVAVPARIHFLSAEPLLGPVTLPTNSGLDWVIIGGESGEHARPFHLEWAESLVRQCSEAGIPAFVKQMGAAPFYQGDPVSYLHKKGEDPSEWPEHLRVQTWPR